MNTIYLNKYLKKRSIHNIAKPHKEIKNKKFDYFIIIPCYNEFDYIFETLKSDPISATLSFRFNQSMS